MPEFTDFHWSSEALRTTWASRLKRISAAWVEVEWQSVSHGLRPCALKAINPNKLPSKARFFAGLGLVVTPVGVEGERTKGYSNASTKLVEGQPYELRVAIGTPEAAGALSTAWQTHDDERVGGLLGFPVCCQNFFKRVWVDSGLRDTTWAMACNTSGQAPSDHQRVISGPPHANILLRWMNVRLVFHLPCSANCLESVRLGKEFERLTRQLGFSEEADWMIEMLDWPIRWSAAGGKATIRTPIMTIESNTDSHPLQREVWRTPESTAVLPGPTIATSAGRPACDNPPTQGLLEAKNADWLAKDNGFSSIDVMTASHKPIVALANSVLKGRNGNILDLGCGNGALLKAIVSSRTGLVPFGVDIAKDRLANAHKLHPAFVNHFSLGDLITSTAPWPEGRRYRLAILMPGRILEAGLEKSGPLLERLANRCDHILLYAYGDWQAHPGGLPKLAADAGFLTLEAEPSLPAQLAIVSRLRENPSLTSSSRP